uniref:SAM domain-containing protein n=1 Tax=Biomphalaria glabrata TaxID=6526 RepID=A0A2C9M306_BIOGL
MMVASQSQHIELEKKVKELGALEKKYHKAKKLIKDYQQREKDFIQERESLFEQQNEKDQQYNSLVKSLKDRIFTLERDLTVAQKAAGLPLQAPGIDEVDIPVYQSKPAQLVMATMNGLEEPLSPLNQSAEDVLEISTSSEISDLAGSPDEADLSFEKIQSLSSSPLGASMATSKTALESQSEFDSLVNSSPLLDSSATRDRANLGNLAHRRPPSKKGKSQDSADEQDSSSTRSELTENGSIHSSTTDHAESGLDMWNKHDSDSTVRKSEFKKRKQQAEVKPSPTAPVSPGPLLGANVLRPPVAPKPKKTDTLGPPELTRDDSPSDTSSSVSQTSYDPNRPNEGTSELPDSIADDLSSNSDGGVTLVSAKASPSAKAASINSDVTSSMMVTEPEIDRSGRFVLNISGTPSAEENVALNKKGQNQIHSGPINEWSVEHVCHWLAANDFEKYSAAFREKNLTGSQLLLLDSSKMKALGISTSKDRDTLKKKIKEVKVNAEREKKLQEKERKLKEKEQKRMSKKK